MEAWSQKIISGEILDPFGQIRKFLIETNIKGADHHSANWLEFNKFLIPKGYDTWSPSKKREANNTFHFFKWGYHQYAPWHYQKKTLEDGDEIDFI